MTFNAQQQRAIKRWISCALPMKGLFFIELQGMRVGNDRLGDARKNWRTS